jgi:hypothetical protein
VIEREIVYCADAAAWERWLEADHQASDGVLLAIAKKTGSATSVRYADAV